MREKILKNQKRKTSLQRNKHNNENRLPIRNYYSKCSIFKY